MIEDKSKNTLISRPELVAGWHRDKNIDLTPDQVSLGSGKKYWWKCPEGPDHEWQARVVDRTNKGRGCPYCAGYRASETNSLASLYPYVADNLDPDRNNGIKADQIVAGSTKRRYWKCPAGSDHQWEASPKHQTSKKECPYCSGWCLSYTNSLAKQFPEVARQLHPDKNNGITADQIIAGARKKYKKYWWKCPEGPDHEWETTVDSRVTSGAGCPCCAGRKISVTNSLATLFPEAAQQLHPEKNNGIRADQILAGSNLVFWWKCPKGPDHEWKTMVVRRTYVGQGCPCCAGHQVSVTNSLASLYPDVAAKLDPDKNNGIRADQIISGSNKRFWWKCPEGPDHEWQAAVYNVVKDDRKCVFCANQRVSVTNSLASLYPDVAAKLDPDKNNGIRADQIISGSNKRFWWKCPEGPDHEWQTSVEKLVMDGKQCVFCANQRVSVTNSLAAVHPAIAYQLDPELNNGVTADQILAGSSKRFTWKCNVSPEHTWDTTVDSRVSQNTGCPKCRTQNRSAQEIRLACELKLFMPFRLNHLSIEGSKGDIFHCDVVIPKHNLVVEFDGYYWHGDNSGKADPRGDDVRKTDRLKEEGWNVIRVREQPLEVLSDWDVSVVHHRDMKMAADAVLDKITEKMDITFKKPLAEYLSKSCPQNAELADREIDKLKRQQEKSRRIKERARKAKENAKKMKQKKIVINVDSSNQNADWMKK